MGPEVKAYEEPNKEQLEGQKKESGDTDKKLDAELNKKDNNNVGNAMGSMAKNEINTTMENLSREEKNNPQYTSQLKTQFDWIQASFKNTVDTITANPDLTPKEKTEKLELAFENFQKEIWSIRAPKEAQDTERGKKQAENMQKDGKKNAEWSQKFKEQLVKAIQDSTEQKLQEQKRMANELWNDDQKKNRQSAWEVISKRWPA